MQLQFVNSLWPFKDLDQISKYLSSITYFFAKFLEILLDSNVTSSHTHTFVDEAKIVRKSFEFIFYDFLLKAPSHETVFKNSLWNIKPIETIKL